MTAVTSVRSRKAQLEALGNHIFDVLVLGGGISGVATAHELTRRGFRTALIDGHDFASGTSQESSQLIWGGIKYLEQGHVRLVSALCRARNEWVEQYPNRVTKQAFLYPRYDHDPHGMPALMAGALGYWMMGGAFGLPPLYRSNASIRRSAPQMNLSGVTGGMEYTDARMASSDARLVLDLLFDAVDAGLSAGNYVEFREARRTRRQSEFEVSVEDVASARSFSIRAQWIVNTTGVWVDEVNHRLGVNPPHELLFSKGVHLVVPRIETHKKALTCMARDGRIFFVIPWGEVTLIGTTDTPYADPPRRVRADQSDIDYLLRECEAKFDLKISAGDVLNTKAGLRPLVRPKSMKGQDFLSLARSHKIWSDPVARVSSLWGGKYTDAFTMAEEVAETVELKPSQEAGLIPPAASPALPSSAEFLRGNGFDGTLADACSREFVVRLEDLLRRRTTIALKVARSGWGQNLEHEETIGKLAEIVAGASDRPARILLDEYRDATLERESSASPA